MSLYKKKRPQTEPFVILQFLTLSKIFKIGYLWKLLSAKYKIQN